MGLHAVFPVTQRHHVRIGVNVLVKDLRIASIGAKSQTAIIKNDGRDARLGRCGRGLSRVMANRTVLVVTMLCPP
jgi:hypothetical protein